MESIRADVGKLDGLLARHQASQRGAAQSSDRPAVEWQVDRRLARGTKRVQKCDLRKWEKESWSKKVKLNYLSLKVKKIWRAALVFWDCKRSLGCCRNETSLIISLRILRNKTYLSGTFWFLVCKNATTKVVSIMESSIFRLSTQWSHPRL